jgi:hypothetical protein
MIKRIVLMCFVLFSLTPCRVKEILFSAVNIEYSKPLNNSKTTSQTNVCQYSPQAGHDISIAKESKFRQQTVPADFPARQRLAHSSVKVKDKHSKSFSGNSPPRYILYKRLKIDTV